MQPSVLNKWLFCYKPMYKVIQTKVITKCFHYLVHQLFTPSVMDELAHIWWTRRRSRHNTNFHMELQIHNHTVWSTLYTYLPTSNMFLINWNNRSNITQGDVQRIEDSDVEGLHLNAIQNLNIIDFFQFCNSMHNISDRSIVINLSNQYHCGLLSLSISKLFQISFNLVSIKC